MTKVVAPSLDELLTSENPAWLWDGERARIVWANGAGTQWFGAETLFDLLEMIFDTSEPAVAAIQDLSNRLSRGKSAEISVKFAAAPTSRKITCQCYIHALADGRTGLLVCGETSAASVNALPAAVQAMALGAFPLPIAVVSGNGDLMFANEALDAILPNDRDFGFADQLIAKSLQSGLTSAIEQIDSRFGKRDMRIIVRLLEKADRLADASFLLVLEDITERRALERSLLAAAEGDIEDDAEKEAAPAVSSERDEKAAPAESQPPAPAGNDVARALDALRKEIENQTIPSAPSASPMAEKAEKQSEAATGKASRDKGEDTGFSVPDIVSSTLNALPQPLVLIDPAGQLLFANDVAVKLMGVDSWPEIGEVTTLADALAALEGEDGSISLFTAKDEAINLDVMITAFPWKDGPVYQATLSPGSDGEEADNRRAVGSKKNTEKVTSAPLAADNPAISSPETAGDNVVSLRPEKPDCGPSDEELRAILDTATDGIVTLDAKGRICSFSAGAEALFGYRSAEVSGKKFSKLLAGKSRKVISDYLEALSGSGLAAVFNDGREVEAKVNNGGIISLFLTIGRLETVRTRAGIIDDGTAAFCVVVRDITQWKKTEADLRKSKESAEKSNAQKSMFLANISHELRTPLNAIMGFSEVMRSERFGEIENEKYLAYANDIHASGGHLLALINDLLDLAKVESGKLELNFTSVNLLNIIDESIHSLQEQATANRVLVRKSAPGDLPNVVADMRSMKQIMLNLLSNSVKFSPPGGQVIITVKLEDNGEMLLTVKDTGRGMDKAELKRALEPFQRVERTADAQTQGTGLGLPLTKALVEANRAKFTITSAPKKGTLVEIVFPTTRVLAE